MSVYRLILRQSMGAGGVWLLLLALVLAVTATTSVRFAADSVRDAVQQQSGQLLAADVALTAPEPIRPVWQSRIQGLRQTSVTLFSSMAQANQQFILVNVKAVGAGYPLRGQLTLAPAHVAQQPPARGTVWVEPRLIDVLGLRLGDALQVGDARLRVAAVVQRDPNRETGLSGFAPTVLMNAADIAATRAIGLGSRVEYRLLLAGTPQQVRALNQQWRKKTDLSRGEQWRSADQGNTRLLKPIELLSDYSQVASLMTLVLCGIAVALSTRRLVDQQLDALALLRCLGADRRQLLQAYSLLFALLWALAVALGALLGWVGSLGLLAVLAQAMNGLELPWLASAFLQPLLTAAATALLMLFGFALPSVLRLLRVSPLRVLRAEQAPASWPAVLVVAVAWLGLFMIVLLQTGQWALSVTVLAAVSLLFALLLGLVWAVLRLLQRHKLAVQHLARQPLANSLRVLSLGLGLGLIGVLLLLRQDLLGRWQTSLPPQTPNQFVYGLPPDQVGAFKSAIAAQGWPMSPLYPNVKGRLQSKNDQPFVGDLAKDRTLQRELNLTTSAVLPSQNQIIEGQPFSAANQVSVEVEVAKRLGLQVGDRIQMQLPEGVLDAKIVNLRSVKWDSFSPNFFFIYSPNTLTVNAGSYLGSFYVPAAQKIRLVPLLQQFSTTLLIDVDALLSEVRRVLQLLGQALGLFALGVVLAGSLVLLASLRALVDERRGEVALLRALGISRQQLQRRLLLELASIGLAAGMVAVILAETVCALVALQIDLSPTLHLWWWCFAPSVLAILAMLMGYLPLRQLWQQSPLTCLRM